MHARGSAWRRAGGVLLAAALFLGGCQHTPDWAKEAWDSTAQTFEGLGTKISQIGGGAEEPAASKDVSGKETQSAGSTAVMADKAKPRAPTPATVANPGHGARAKAPARETHAAELAGGETVQPRTAAPAKAEMRGSWFGERWLSRLTERLESGKTDEMDDEVGDATAAVPQSVNAGGSSASGMRPLSRIAFGSCADQREAQPIWASVLGAEPDLFLFMGDNVYGDTGPAYDPADANLTALRAAYAEFSNVAGFQTLRAKTPVLATWDDHDYGRNDAGADFPHRQTAEAIFRAFWDMPDTDPAREGIYSSHMFGPEGQRVQVIMLDTRSFRSPLKETDKKGAPGKERYVPDLARTKTLLGAEQWAWLEEELTRPAQLRLIVSSIQVIAEGHGWERWGNLPIEREVLFNLIAQTRANGVVFLSGDRHVGALYREDAAPAYPLYEVTASSLNRPAKSITYEAGPKRVGGIYNKENFGVIEIDWAARMISLQLRGLDGEAVRSYAVNLDDLEPRTGTGAAARR